MHINYDDHNYIPERLPCGKRVNEEWTPSKKLESCRTVCRFKDDFEIEMCYRKGGGRVKGTGRFL